jgi:hypothetical protein
MTAEGSAASVLSFGEDWAGLTQSGRILISIERIVNGAPLGQILSHEMAHNALLKSTQLGLSQLALSTHALDPAPRGELRRRCGRLLESSVSACRFTHEAVASFLPSVALDAAELAGYRARHPQDYLDAAGALEWLRARPIPGEAKEQLAFAAGILALAVLDLDQWRRERLHETAETERWFGIPAHRPDRRFPALCRTLAALPDPDLAAAADGGVAAVLQACRDVTVAGQRLSFIGLMDSRPTAEWLEELAASLFGPLIGDPSLPAWERRLHTVMWAHPVIALPALAPALMSVSLTPTTSTEGRIDFNPLVAELRGYPLVQVLQNAFDWPVPGVEPVDRDPLLLQPGESALWFITPDRGGRACHLSPGRFREWLDATGDDVTVCVRDGTYFFGVPIGEPRLKRRRHVVLVQHRTPQQLVVELAVLGLDENRGPVFMTRFDSDYESVAYLLLRPESGSPVVILPTARVTADRVSNALLERTGKVSFVSVLLPEFVTSNEMLIDVLRVLTNFEAKPWLPELLPAGDQTEPLAAAAGAGDELDPLMDEAARTWQAYHAQSSSASLASFVRGAEGILAARQLQTAPLARRAEVLQAIAGSFVRTGDQHEDEALLRRAVAISEDLLSVLPGDWPGRFRPLRIAGYAWLCLSVITGEAGDRRKAYHRLSESRVLFHLGVPESGYIGHDQVPQWVFDH